MTVKKSAPTRSGRLIRTAWKVKDKSNGKCAHCDWRPQAGIRYQNMARNCREHAEETGHTVRFAAVEVVEYRRV